MLLNLTQIVIYLLFFQLLYRLITQLKSIDLIIVMLALVSVTIGEAYNLMVFKMAVYKGVEGIPLYIILGGAMVSWGIHEIAVRISEKNGIECPFCQIFIVCAISLLLPVIEILGLKTELWYWRRSFRILSLVWFVGVWKFYFMSVALPAIIGVILNMFRVNYDCSCQITKSQNS